MNENDLMNGTGTGYRKEEDFEKDQTEKYENLLLKNDFEAFVNEETSEPEIMYWCKDSPEATELLRKCVKMMSEKNWTTIKKYLKEIIDQDEISLLNKDADSNKKLFVKNFYLGIAHFKLGELDESLQSFFEANKHHQYYQLNYNIALCYMKQNNLENAAFYLEAVTKKNKNFFFAYYNLIKIYLKKNNINDAYLIYRDFSDVKIRYN